MAKKNQQQLTLGSIRCSFHYLLVILLALLVVTVIYLTQVYTSTGRLADKTNSLIGEESSSSSCNLFAGKWVFDNESYPPYKERQCTFMSDQLACEKFGRKDLSYQFLRWQPHQCDLPRSLILSLILTLYLYIHTRVYAYVDICVCVDW